MRRLAEPGIPVRLLLAPLIPALNDEHMEAIMERAREAGASGAGYVLLRLPLEIRDLFVEWLEEHYPLKREHVMARVRDSRGGRDYDAAFGRRMTGSGVFAELLAKRFRLAAKRLGFGGEAELDCVRFRAPGWVGKQLTLLRTGTRPARRGGGRSARSGRSHGPALASPRPGRIVRSRRTRPAPAGTVG